MDSPPHLSVSRQIETRFNRRRVLRWGVAGLYISGSLIYLAWRGTIMNPHAPGVSAAFYLAEWIGFILGLTVIFGAWRYNHRAPGPAPSGVTVDVLIPTYKEPAHVIRRTVMAARDIRYPHQTWILDDARRPEIEAIATSLGVRYLARPFNENAKAGNLNHGLRHSNAEFVVVFDADHVAQPHALEALLGLVTSDRIAMVQTPQDYYNIDAFQYINPRKKAGLWHDQSYFYNLAQACRDSWNASSCVGTGVLYRRTALDSIGGIPVDTVTEDFHTSLKLHRLGWETCYLNEPVAFGIAAADLGEYYKTRHRWAHGNLAVLRHERILTCSGLTLKQRLSYLSLGLIYLEGWQQLLLFLIPLAALTLGWAPFEISIFNVLAVLAYPVVGYLLLQEFGCGFSRFWTNELFAMARWPVHLASAAALFGRKLQWKSSKKNIQGRISWWLMAPQLSVFIVGGAVLGYAAWRLHEDFLVGPLAMTVAEALKGRWPPFESLFAVLPPGYSVELVAIAGFWVVFNMARVAAFVAKAVRNARQSHTFFRFPVPLPVTFPGLPGILAQTESVAEDWVRLRMPVATSLDESYVKVILHLPDGPLAATIAISNSEGSYIEGHFNWDCAASLDRLAATLHSIGWQRELQSHHAYFLTPSDVLGRVMGLRAPGVERRRVWSAGLLQADNTTPLRMPVLLSVSDGQPEHHEIISFDVLHAGEEYVVQRPEASGCRSRLQVVEEIPIASLPHPGLNGTAFRRYLAILARVA